MAPDVLLTGQSGGQSVSLTLIQGSISSSRCMLCSSLVLRTSHALNFLGSYNCYPGLPLVPLSPSPRSRTTRLLWHWLAHNNSCLWWDGWPTSLPPSAIFPLHIFILSLIIYNLGCRVLSLSLLLAS